MKLSFKQQNKQQSVFCYSLSSRLGSLLLHLILASIMILSVFLCRILTRLEGKVVLITGGASGISATTARLFFKHGAKVVIADMQDELGHSVCKELDPQFTTFVHCDVNKETDVENVVNHAISMYGKPDIMYNNAGIARESQYNILDNTQSDFEQVIRVNLVGAFLGTKYAARVMIPARKGSIINTASVCSIMGGLAPPAYTSSKHAVVGLMKNVAVELGIFGICVNCVSPYLVLTPMAKDYLKQYEEGALNLYSNLKGEVLKPEGVAEVALFLGSDKSKYVSGHNLVIEGGFSIVNSGFCMYPQ